jgi:uncharacterized protein YdhG (YjbR/CyaY superfamily)
MAVRGRTPDAGQAAEKARAYLAALPPEARRALQKLRAAVLAAAPKAEESFSYGIPGFRLEGKALVWYAAWKQHCSLYPIGPAIVRSLGAAAEGYETAKGTIRFPLREPPPASLVKRLVRARVAELRARGK